MTGGGTPDGSSGSLPLIVDLQSTAGPAQVFNISPPTADEPADRTRRKLPSPPASNPVPKFASISQQFAATSAPPPLPPPRPLPTPAASIEAMRQRTEAFASRLATEPVSGWELSSPPHLPAPTWEKKLFGSSSVIRWSSTHQPAIVLQRHALTDGRRFIRRVRQEKKIREAVHYHATSAASQTRVALLVRLIQSERRYVAQLQTITEVWMPGLEGALDLGVFGPIRKIEYVHREMLAALEKRQNTRWLQMRVDDLFSHQLAPRLGLYTEYAAQHPGSTARLDRLLETNPELRARVRRLEGVAGVCWPSIFDLLASPLNRLEWYSRMLQQLLLVCGLDPGEEEYFGLAQSVVAIQGAVRTIREGRRSCQQQARHRLVQDCLGRSLPAGPLLQHGLLHSPAAEDGSSWYFVLTRGSLMGFARGSSVGFELKHRLDLHQAALQTEARVASTGVQTRAIGQGNAFIVTDGSTSLPLIAPSHEQKQGWVAALEGLIDEAHRMRAVAALKSDELAQRREAAQREAEVLQARLVDEKEITAQIGRRGLDALDQLGCQLDELVSRLEAYEETVLWPAVVSALMVQQKRPAVPEDPVVVAEQQLAPIVAMAQLQAGIGSADDAIMERAGQLVEAESQMDGELSRAVERTWLELEEHFEHFFEDMASLEQVMDSSLAGDRAAVLSECDHIRQQLLSLDHKIVTTQSEAGQLTESNASLAQEIAEQTEELELLKLRLGVAP